MPLECTYCTLNTTKNYSKDIVIDFKQVIFKVSGREIVFTQQLDKIALNFIKES
jgi:hypothetical protein